jgi:hypothetical protein
MRKLLIASLILLESLTAGEVGIATTNLGSVYSGGAQFGFVYRFGSETSPWRLHALTSNLSRNDLRAERHFPENNSNLEESQNLFLNTNIRFGREFRYNIDSNLIFKWGIDLGVNYGVNISDSEVINAGNVPIKNDTDGYTIGGSLFAPIGAYYKLGSKFILGFEIAPSFNHSFSDNTTLVYRDSELIDTQNRKVNSSTFNINFAESILISLAYRF